MTNLRAKFFNMKALRLSLMVLLACVVIKANSQSKKDTIPSFLGFSYMPSQNWKVWNIVTDDGDYFKHKFDVNSQSSIEGNFGINRIGLRLGLTANFENNLIGKAYRYGGYIGYKRFWLRIQSSKFSGSVEWTSPNPTTFARKNNFSNRYFTVELLRMSNAYKRMAGGVQVNRIMGTYWGIGYTTISVPLKVSTLVTPGGRENQEFGKPAYDSLFRGQYYTACFGFDLLRQLSLTGGRVSAVPGKRAMKFGVYAATQDKVGFGPGEHSSFAVRMAEEQNPGLKFVNPRGFSALVHYYLTVGFRYYIDLKPAFLVVAAGYDFEGASIFNFGGAADTKKDLGYESSFFYIAHGVTFKIYLSWFGK